MKNTKYMLNNKNFKTVIIYNRENIDQIPNFNQKYLKTGKAVGLCNQLFSLINNIIISAHNFIVIDSFYLGHNVKKCAPISEILNLELMSYKFSDILNRKIYLLDRNKLNLNIISVFYGTAEKKIDVTNKFNDHFFINNNLSKNININLLFTDPVLNKQKSLYLTYKLDSYIIKEQFLEVNNHLQDDISFNLNKLKYNWNNVKHSLGWTDHTYFNLCLNNIVFSDSIKEIIRKININIYQTIHLRLEDDSIDHWSTQNNISKLDFKQKLVNKYLTLINNYIDVKKNVLILSGLDKNDIFYNNLNQLELKFLDKEYLLKDFKYKGQEINAILDLEMGKKTKNLFIGCHNLKEKRGSSFSYTLINKLEGLNKYLIDLDNIN